MQEQLPLPGEFLVYDYRKDISTLQKSSLKILQWNVERNYESEAIIATLKELDPDIAILQEIDINCKRSQNRNHMQELCQKLRVKGGFVCEFLELDSPRRRQCDEGGGIHGNAILSKYDVDFRVLNHHYQGYDWDCDGDKLREPRKGRRYTLIGIVQAPHLPPLRCYSVHLEVFTGIIGRVSSFSEIFEDAAIHANDTPHQIIFGDLNTMGHSIARLSPKYACDRYRYLTLGETESAWWDRTVFGFHRSDGPINTSLAKAGFPTALWQLLSLLIKWSILEKVSGFDLAVLRMARNPGFYDPWDPDDVTLENPDYFGLFKAKLDWTLLRCLEVTKKWSGNKDYSASDHAYLMVEIIPDKVSHPEQCYQTWLHRRQRPQTPHSLILTTLVVLLLAFAIHVFV
ncbi:hypothetical protein DFQ28_010066 [Apophysomyces sp. BC1034]|nr:hypothetical protein DFQ30_009708 [Apophysomyces sp. BC1015]KAG0172076.1 hypothetical protein DFQ29_008529 [Apophysomyces sp. BC1021]KAG0185035.1 hypothetical protein DFQ28_010066 [Apophysomyces sp. BC1034]